MWIVRLALRRPYTIAVLVIAIMAMGTHAIRRMSVDILPAIDIPVAVVMWTYPGLSAEEMERRVVTVNERLISATVNGIRRIESQSVQGSGIVRVYFDEGVELGSSIAQISAASLAAMRQMPPSTPPPLIVPFNVSNLPVAQIVLSSESVPEQQLYDWGQNFLRMKLFTIPGLSIPPPYGGMARQIAIDIDRARLSAKGLSPFDVVSAVQASNLILPSGVARIGGIDYSVLLNSSPSAVDQFGAIPMRVVNGQTILVSDVAKVTDSNAEQTNAVRINGRRSTFMNLVKKLDGSTLSIIESVKEVLPGLEALAPEGVKISLEFDQSEFVHAAIMNVIVEAIISSILVSFMILIFLRSWRSVIIVCTSIPLSIACGLVGLYWTGHSINIMTLGGLSLAIGMLVDDATVEIENIHRNRLLGLPLTPAIMAGASQIALPAIMATLAICLVFFPVTLLEGSSQFLFTPMALAVVFSMLASYVLSRTLVPLLSRLLLVSEKHSDDGHKSVFERGFSKLQRIYESLLQRALAHRDVVLVAGLCAVILTSYLPASIGFDFFPRVDAGLIKLHFRAPSGSNLVETENLVAKIEAAIRDIIPKSELNAVNSLIGVPPALNVAFAPTDNVGGMDAEIYIGLNASHQPSDVYINKIRQHISAEFPGCTAYFQPADIINQVLSFGLGTPIDVQIEGPDFEKSHTLAVNLMNEMHKIPGIVDLHIKQQFDYPAIHLNVDRIQAARMGLSQRDVANSLLVTLSGSATFSPTYYLNPANGVSYIVAVKQPARDIGSVDDILATPVTPQGGANEGSTPGVESSGSRLQILGNLATSMPARTLSEANHVDIQRVVNIAANVEGKDLASVLKGIDRAIGKFGELPKGHRIKVRGQGEIMTESFRKLGLGLIFSIILVYLLMVVLFQSWLDPFIVLVAVPGALIGILWMLYITGTTINVVSFMGSIMAVGIAASNSILLVSFANDLRVEKGLSPLDAARVAASTRLRPVLMTALAMMIGMMPAALGLGEGGEQNAPLGRAVIGGLTIATLVTLFVVPVIYSLLRRNMPTAHLLDEKLIKEESEQAHASST